MGIALAPLVVDIKANLLPFSNGIDTASRKGSDFERQMEGVKRELKLTESGFKVAGSSAELLGNKTATLTNKQRELTEKMKLQSRAIDINKEAYKKIEDRLQKYVQKNDKLKSTIEKVTKKHQEAEKTYGKEAEQTKKLADKLSNLNEKFENNKKKIQATTEKLDNQKIKLNEWQAELLQSQKALNKTNKELKEFNLTKMSEKLGKASNGLKSVGSTLTTNVTLPLAGIATVASHVGIEFEAQMDKVSAISGATGDEFKSLEAKAEEMGSKTKFSATNAGQAMEYMAMAGWKSKDMLDGIEPVLNLAIASGEDLGRTSDIVTDALTAFGLTAKDTAMFTDVLAAASSNANTNVNLMGETFKYAAPVAGALGYNVKDTALAIGLMANSGIKASQSGTSLRAGLTNLVKPTDSMYAAMKRYNISVTDSNGKMKSFRTFLGELRSRLGHLEKATQTATVAQIFGKQAMSGWLAIINASQGDFDKLAESIDKSEGATEKMAKTMADNAKGSLAEMKSALEEAAIKGFKVIAPLITDVAKGVGSLANSFSELTPETQQLILKFGAVAIAAGPVLSVTGKLTGGFVKLIDLTKKLKTATVATGAVMKSATVATEGLAVATQASGAASGVAALGFGSVASVALPLVGILGAVAGGVYLYTKNTEVMSSSCLQTKEELGLVGNALLALNGQYALSAEEMDKMNIRHKEWSDKISPETKKALTELSDKVATLKFDLAHANGLDGVISESDINNLKQRTNKLFDETIAKIKERAPETQKEMAEAFKADDGKLDENEEKLMEFFNKSQSQQIEKINELSKKANSIYENAAKEHRDIKKEEQDEINKLLDEAATIQMNNTVKNNDELLAAQADFNARMNNLDMTGLSNLLKEKDKARDAEVQSVKTKYDKQIENIKLSYSQMDSETQKHADAEILKLENLKRDSVKKENDKYQGYIDAAKDKYPQLDQYINTATGEIMTKQQKQNAENLVEYSKQLDGLEKISKTGYYEIYNNVTKSMQKCYVEVDDSTGEITGLWEQSVNRIYGNPIKAKDDIKNDIKNGRINFTVIDSEYKKNKDAVENNPVKPKSEQNKGIFDWVKDAWRDNVQYVIDHPIKSFTDWVGGSIQKAPNFHYNGLDNVPFDGYLARLHKGERVLTADENASYNKGTGDIQVTNNFYGRVDSPYEVAKATKRSMRELQY